VGENEIEYENVDKKEKIYEIKIRVRKIMDKVEKINKEKN
jgi:hypothetical protein